MIPWLVGLGAVIVCGLGWYAWSLTSQLKSLANTRSKAKQDAMMGIKVLIDSYFDNQVVDYKKRDYDYYGFNYDFKKRNAPLITYEPDKR